ncbi:MULTISPECIES: lipopolysaccharide biosynthesis protein [Photorhabdus]|uniref:Polysaccharide biosynthesis domain protein n=2 Tax=Photorhabdus asymbiotica TaxID=291112 RepID=C7BSB9_PHOAA|nr:oligosaccharide flippase family protein [Photorhabdus asymbiotica]RKS60244.1 O-antigen/teichoic acid export membrane protein [Photorhabdus asymbiotica]CAQ86417.1 polysaccharide biosynthesis domain protein [Photorhabdus asymbiotica]
MIKRNIIANYIGQFYLAIIGLVVIPFYLEKLGSEGYGLIGFFTMLQGWMQLLDMGISTTIAREATIAKNNQQKAIFFKGLQKAITYFFLLIAMMIFLSGIMSAEWITKNWLTTSLSVSLVTFSVSSMFVTIAFRWLCGPWRSTLIGLEKQIQLNIINIIIATLRFPVSVIILILTHNSLYSYFIYQIIIAFIELIIFYLSAIYHTPYKDKSPRIDKKFIRESIPILKFALSIAFTSGVWVLITQTDKLLLSYLLPLNEFGFYSMGVIAASGLMILSQPIAQAILPRLTSLHVEQKNKELIFVYRNSSRIMALIILPVSILLSGYAYHAIYIWTGSHQVAKEVTPILCWYALGNGILAISAFPYYLQYAHGNIRLHVIGNIIFLITFIPTIYFTGINYGATGVAKTWFFQNLIYLIIWAGIVHKRFLPNSHIKWLFLDIMPFMLFPLLFIFFQKNIEAVIPDSRVIWFILLILLGGTCLMINKIILKTFKNE